MTRLTTRSSTIFIATSDKTRVYHSLSDVPPDLRRRLQEYTRGVNSATILIADKRGREELVRALQGHSSDVQCRVANRARARQESAPLPEKPERNQVSLSIRTFLELLLPIAVAASLWFFIGPGF
ncbi:MAG: hypothetical protein JO061_11350 [Acidobacteriaceae bacterium]|nr:hypothetical protein [Acidobacteriaceae bacterium]